MGCPMPSALLVKFFHDLPTPRQGEDFEIWRTRHFRATQRFKKRLLAKYNEGTLLRLLQSDCEETRKGALFALGLTASMDANLAMSRLLHDDDGEVVDMATAGMWNLWFRASIETNNKELQRLLRLRDREKALAGLMKLAELAPDFAEVYNQRAIVYFRLKQYEDSITDCQKALEINPWHFGAQVGMAQCFMKLRKHRSALKAFRATLKIHPRMEGVRDAIRTLERVLGEEGRRDDKK
ncbi:MAG: tetratricopeptide repeat protein [Gemmataceae bacterium]|nr:tetratricopeptide repeat protein [Gemmataceae bacterium]